MIDRFEMKVSDFGKGFETTTIIAMGEREGVDIEHITHIEGK